VPQTKSRTVHKNFRLDPAQIARAQKVLGASTETETIVRALDHVISEAERNRLALQANQKFLSSGIVIEDAFGSLG
jgi:Arc/MetJ family transcription regulator